MHACSYTRRQPAPGSCSCLLMFWRSRRALWSLVLAWQLILTGPVQTAARMSDASALLCSAFRTTLRPKTCTSSLISPRHAPTCYVLRGQNFTLRGGFPECACERKAGRS